MENNVIFKRGDDTIEASYRESLRNSYLRAHRNGVSVSDAEIFYHVPKYLTEAGLKEAAIIACEDYDRIMAKEARMD